MFYLRFGGPLLDCSHGQGIVATPFLVLEVLWDTTLSGLGTHGAINGLLR